MTKLGMDNIPINGRVNFFLVIETKSLLSLSAIENNLIKSSGSLANFSIYTQRSTAAPCYLCQLQQISWLRVLTLMGSSNCKISFSGAGLDSK